MCGGMGGGAPTVTHSQFEETQIISVSVACATRDRYRREAWSRLCPKVDVVQPAEQGAGLGQAG